MVTSSPCFARVLMHFAVEPCFLCRTSVIITSMTCQIFAMVVHQSKFANSGPTVWNRIDGMLVSWNTVNQTDTIPTKEACLSYCLTYPTCVALEFKSGNSPHCALDSVGRFEAGADWEARMGYNYYDFYYSTRGLL